MTFFDIPTPALVVDAAALQRNIERMARFFATGPCRLRPHFKAHKTPEIARRQLAAGSVTGLTCATVREAETAVALCDDILIANEVIGQDTCRRVAALARGRTMTVAVDSASGARQMAEAARHAGVTVRMLVDVNVGQNRCGVAPGRDARELARLVAGEGPHLHFQGVMGYEGHVQPVSDRADRERLALAAMDALVGTARQLHDAGLPCPVVSAGGTGTYDISGRVDGVTEIQAGSYALMDADYGRLGLPFEQALFVLGTVLSRPAADRCVADCGHKSVTKDHGHPLVEGINGASVTALNDEHAVIALPPDSTMSVGDRIRLRPSHIDPTVNLHDVIYVLEGDRVVDVWPVAARGYGRP